MPKGSPLCVELIWTEIGAVAEAYFAQELAVPTKRADFNRLRNQSPGFRKNPLMPGQKAQYSNPGSSERPIQSRRRPLNVQTPGGLKTTGEFRYQLGRISNRYVQRRPAGDF